jgi:hypothetical protein
MPTFGNSESIDRPRAHRTSLQGAREVRSFQATPVNPCSRLAHLNRAPRSPVLGIYRANDETRAKHMIMLRHAIGHRIELANKKDSRLPNSYSADETRHLRLRMADPEFRSSHQTR